MLRKSWRKYSRRKRLRFRITLVTVSSLLSNIRETMMLSKKLSENSMKEKRNQFVQVQLRKRFGQMQLIQPGETEETLSGVAIIGAQLKIGKSLKEQESSMMLGRTYSVIKIERLSTMTNTPKHRQLEKTRKSSIGCKKFPIKIQVSLHWTAEIQQANLSVQLRLDPAYTLKILRTSLEHRRRTRSCLLRMNLESSSNCLNICKRRFWK